jgi:hypothetical protein
MCSHRGKISLQNCHRALCTKEASINSERPRVNYKPEADAHYKSRFACSQINKFGCRILGMKKHDSFYVVPAEYAQHLQILTISALHPALANAASG